MHKRIYRPMIIILAIMLGVSGIGVTFAWLDFGQHKTNAFAYSDYTYSVTLHKYEKDNTGAVTETLIPGAEFYLYKAGDPQAIPPIPDTQVGGRYVTDVNGRINIAAIEPGDYYFLETHPGYSYTYDKDSEDKDIARYDFTIGTDKDDVDVHVHAYNVRLDGGLIISKAVHNADNSDLTEAQRNTEFTFTVTFSDGKAYPYKLNGAGEEISVASGGTLKLKHGQTAVFETVPVGIQYTVTETPVAQYTAQSEQHQGNITEIGRIANFVNTYTKAPGSLIITKTVTGMNADLNKEFEFTAVIGGVEHTFTLKHGESKTFADIPAGTPYTVTEADYTSEGYIAAPEEYTGNAINGVLTLPFVNTLEDESADPGRLEISKTVQNADGSALTAEQLVKEFTFTVTIGNTVETVTLKHGESKTFDNIPAGIIYKVEETPADGYTAAVTVADGIIAANHTAQVGFINEKDKDEEPKETALTVKKVVTGEISESEADRGFAYTLEIEGMEPINFTLKAGETKTFEHLPVGAEYVLRETDTLPDGYALTGVTNGSGTLTEVTIAAGFTNTFIGRVMIEIEGEKTWNKAGQDIALPESITVNLKDDETILETKTVTPDESGNWKYTFEAPKYDMEDQEITYTVEEIPVAGWNPECNGYNIKNTYVPPVTADSVTVEKIITGDTPKENADFQFKLTAQNGAPLPDGSTDGSKIVTINGAGTANFGSITYANAGTYIYTVTELNNGTDGYTYDNAVYTWTVTVIEESNKLIVQSAVLTKDDSSETHEKAVFTNTYEFVPSNEKVTVSGVKTWDHGGLDERYHPQAVTILVKNGDNVVIEHYLTADQHWQYAFKLNKYDSEGNEITYTVEEVYQAGYTATVNGYDIHNTYNPADPNKPEENPPQTGDDSLLIQWFVVMIVSSLCLAAMVSIQKRMGRKHRCE